MVQINMSILHLHLNSIMILLIPASMKRQQRSNYYLNSIMILLIQFLILTVLMAVSVFKFHYDSINSFFTCCYIYNYIINLNSIMILSIQTRIRRLQEFLQDLNSIMILLIPTLISIFYTIIFI